MTKFYMGNCLRGYIEGNFSTVEEAWEGLSAYFNITYCPLPEDCTSGRSVMMFISIINEYGFKDTIQCRDGRTFIGEANWPFGRGVKPSHFKR